MRKGQFVGVVDDDLPGKPDIVFRQFGKVILVHGCFWHRHDCPNGCALPSTRRVFWEKKFAENVARDLLNQRALTELGWTILVIWECETKNREQLRRRINGFLSG